MAAFTKLGEATIHAAGMITVATVTFRPPDGEEFERPERVRLRQILLDDPEAVERALAELKEGAEFDQVARRYSRDSTGETGGVQGELSRDDLPPLFADTIFALEPGEVSDVVEAEYGFHLFQVMEQLPAEVLALACFIEGRHAQALPSFGSERTGAPVAAFVRVSDRPIRSHDPVEEPHAGGSLAGNESSDASSTTSLPCEVRGWSIGRPSCA